MPPARPEALHVSLDLDPDHLARAVGEMESPAILESGPGFGDAGRWCFYAAEPRKFFWASDSMWVFHDTGSGFRPPYESGHDPLDGLTRLLERYGLDVPHDPPRTDEPPFRGGLIGFYSYDLAPRLERLLRRCRADSVLFDIFFGVYDTVVSFDRRLGRAVLSAYDLTGDGRAALHERLDRWRRKLEQGPTRPLRHKAYYRAPIASNFTREDYVRTVERALEYIRAGDVFQVNVAQQFQTSGAVRPFELFLRTREACPAPFAAYLNPGAWAWSVISASPEWFYQTRGARIVTRPIKGTRPRGTTEAEDAALIAQLRSSPKEHAELAMIVDLERNDLGRVCQYGSVHVTEPYAIESFAQVHHQVATVQGRLRPECGPVDVLKAMFPGGSITGAPKIRAMEIIDELEPCRRGLYTGAIGYHSYGASAFNIAIRTLIAEHDRVHYHVGGGIVADSDPEQEFLETLHKGAGLRAVLEGAGACFGPPARSSPTPT